MACMRDGFESGRLLDNGRYITVSALNHGSFGMVLAAKDTTTGEDVAIKCITKPGASTTCPVAIAIDDRSEELAIHSRLQQHPNIVNLLHYFETTDHSYMVLELCNNGDLYEAIRLGKGPLETEHVRDFMLQLVDAIHYLHSRGVAHRDIKPENLFLSSSGALKVGDFGLATCDTWSTEFAVGSDRYMAPEQYDASVYGYGYSPEAADVWAVGIVLLNVLFQRNPFATPAPKDPLFADFARDRQSLFDLFPSMSQDTYNVLVHSLALDPAHRSLAAVREALNAVVSFTIDDESLDDFCTDQNDLVPVATAAREPLRTPSVTSPVLGSDDSFPWSNALLKTQPTTRQLSTIKDDESDLFPVSASSWQYVDPDEASLSSALDSGLGLSYKSTKSIHSVGSIIKPKSTVAGSLPISFSRPSTKSSPYGASGFSKSWSDLWDEEEEMLHEEYSRSYSPGDVAFNMEMERVSTAQPNTPQLQCIREEGRGSVTPRQGLVDIDANILPTQSTKIPVAEDKVMADLPKTKSSSILDKWAALGNFRRAKHQDTTPAAAAPVVTAAAVSTPLKTKYSDAFASFTSFSSNKRSKAQPKQRDRAASWRQGNGSPPRLRASSFNNSKVWQEDNNWREHRSPPMKTPSPPPSTGRASGSRRPRKNFLDDEFDDGDVEWVGGWSELPL